MKIGLLEAGRPPPGLIERHGDYRAMFRDLLADALPEAEFVDYAAIDGHLPRSLDEVDGWLISGSAYSVYDPDPWIGALKKRVREAIDRGQPVFGICFGHQLVADVMGGKVQKAEQGWGVGVHDYRVETPAPWMADAKPGDVVSTLVSHQDQVTVPPPGAEVLASLINDGVMPKGVDYGVMEGAMNNGEVAMVINGPWSWANLEASGIEFGVFHVTGIRQENHL